VIFKIIVVSLLLFVIFSLGMGLLHLLRGKEKSDKLLKSLTWRIGLSVALFILLIIGQAVGLITPHGLP
jgi:hypothetical protein